MASGFLAKRGVDGAISVFVEMGLTFLSYKIPVPIHSSLRVWIPGRGDLMAKFQQGILCDYEHPIAGGHLERDIGMGNEMAF